MNKNPSIKAPLVALLFATLSSTVLPLTGLAATTQSTAYTYNTQGLLETIDGPRTDISDITTLAYDTHGNLTQITNALGHSTQITSHDASGRPLQAISNNQMHIQLTYDVRGRLIQSNLYALGSNPLDGRQSTYTYTPAGDVESITLPSGQSLTYTYDAARRLTDIVDNDGNRVSYDLDAMGNQLAEHIYASNNALVRQRSAVYNQLGQLFQSLGAQNQTTEYSYDPNGNTTHLQDPRNNPTQLAFDPLNRLTQVTDAHQGVTLYSYDQASNLSSVTDPKGNATVYQHDGLGNLVRQSSPDTGITTYQYDSAGNRISETNANGIVINYNYDPLNRLTESHFPDSTQNVYYDYDGNNYQTNDPTPASHAPIGQLTGMRDNSGRTLWYYNDYGELIQQTQTLNASGRSYTLSYRYQSGTGLLSDITYPSGDMISYSYNNQGQVQSIDKNAQSIVDTVQYQPFGGINRFNYGNGLSLSRSFDWDGRLQSQLIGGAAPLQQLSWGYDPVSSVNEITDQLDSLKSQTFAYDNLDRLISATTDLSGYGLLAFSYDANGNRLQQDDNSQLTDYSLPPTSNRLSASSGDQSATYNYDPQGNIIAKSDISGNYTYTYNQSNRLSQIEQDGLPLSQYRYNGLGQRSNKTLSDALIDYVYSPSGQLIAEINTDTGAFKEYLYLDGEPLLLSVQAPPNLDSYQLTGTDTTNPANQVSILATVSSQTLAITFNDGRQRPVTLTGNQWQTSETVSEWVHTLNYSDATGLSINGTITTAKVDNRSHAALTIVEVPQQQFTQSYQASGIVTQVSGVSKPKNSFEFGFINGTMIVTSRETAPAAPVASTLANVDTATKIVTVTYADGSTQDFPIAASDWTVTPVGQYTKYNFSYQQGGDTLSGYLLQGANESKASIDMQLGYESNASYTMPIQTNGLDVAQLYYYHNDHLGTPKLLTDANQAVVWEGQYSPFGEVTALVEQVENNLRFAGQYFDAESGLHYNYHRYYDPSLGRYITSDPIGLEGGLNTYTYVENNPLNFIDFFGLASSGQTKNLGGGNTVRVDNPHVPGQQKHAHVTTPKGTVVVNQDGTQSHTNKGDMKNLTNKLKKYLRNLGFRIRLNLPILNPCLIDPFLPGCSNDPTHCPSEI